MNVFASGLISITTSAARSTSGVLVRSPAQSWMPPEISMKNDFAGLTSVNDEVLPVPRLCSESHQLPGSTVTLTVPGVSSPVNR